MLETGSNLLFDGEYGVSNYGIIFIICRNFYRYIIIYFYFFFIR